MSEAHDFISHFHNQLRVLKELLQTILREEQLLKENILVRSGFLLRQYALKLSTIRLEDLKRLREELDKVSILEENIRYRARKARKWLKEIEEDYEAYHKHKLHLRRIFTQHMNNAFRMSRHASMRTQQLIQLLEDGVKLHHPISGRKTNHLLKSVERMINQVLLFVDLLEQLESKISKFEANSYYPSPRVYGRIMSSTEFRKTKSYNRLSSRQEPTPVFDAPVTVQTRIRSMKPDERRRFFSSIGVRSTDNIVFFQTNLKPLVGPIPQSNGLREYKFPRGSHIELLEVA